MPGRPPKVDHVREAFLRASSSAHDLATAVPALSAIQSNAGHKLHPEQARRVVELAFLGLIAAWDEFLEQTFVRYLAGAKTGNGFRPTLRLGKASDIGHSYHLISGDPGFDPARSYSKFSDPKWVIAIAKNYFVLGAPYATSLQPHLELLQHAIRLRNRVAHNSTKCRSEFLQAARIHLGISKTGVVRQGYSVGDLLVSRADRVFGQEARNKKWSYFQAYTARLRAVARRIAPG